MQDFSKLRVWHLAQAVALEVIEAFPVRTSGRVPGLRHQAIRAASSVPANIAEGCGRSTRSEFLHFIEVALASTNELEAHLRLAVDARILATNRHARLYSDVVVIRRMLVSLMRAVQRRMADDINAARPSNTRPGELDTR